MRKRISVWVGALGLALVLFWIGTGVLSFQDIFTIVCAMAGLEGSAWLYDRFIENPYRWKCPDCGFRMKTSSESVDLMVKEQHYYSHRKKP